MPRVEMMLYHGNPRTGTIQISTTADTGPWTSLTLTSTQCVIDAIEEWEDLANAALPLAVWQFSHDFSVISLESTGDQGWIKLSPCMAALLGFSSTVLDGYDPAQSDLQPLGMIDQDLTDLGGIAVGLDFPTDVEDAELSDYRAARATSLHYGRAVEVTVDLIVSPELWAVAEGSPIFGGHAAFKVVQDNEAAFDEDNLDGFLVVYPVEELEREREADDDPCWIRLRCTTKDP